MTKKATKSKAKEVKESNMLEEFGRGFLRFFEIIFKFILDLLKVLPEFLKAIAWIILVVVLAGFVGVLIIYFTFTALGIKDSPEFQMYREAFVNKFIEEHELMEKMDEIDFKPYTENEEDNVVDPVMP